jgi:hypothetical protein
MSEEKFRAHYLPAVNWVNLNHAARAVNESLPGFGCYLVGSSMAKRDYRDVDVRFIMRDDEYDRMFKNPDGTWNDRLWSLMCTSITFWMSQQSGLPVDFQIQRQTDANARHKGKLRNALGIAEDYPGELPSFRDR